MFILFPVCTAQRRLEGLKISEIFVDGGDSILLFLAFIYAFALINRNHYFVIDNVERTFAYTDDKLVVISPERKQQLIDFKDIACFSCDTDGVVLILKNGETTDLRRLRDYLDKNPGANAQQVADDLHFSLRTAQRRLAELKKSLN